MQCSISHFDQNLNYWSFLQFACWLQVFDRVVVLIIATELMLCLLNCLGHAKWET